MLPFFVHVPIALALFFAESVLAFARVSVGRNGLGLASGTTDCIFHPRRCHFCCHEKVEFLRLFVGILPWVWIDEPRGEPRTRGRVERGWMFSM